MLPLSVLALGALAVAVAARRLAAEVAALRPQVAGLRQFRDDAREIYLGADATRRRGAAAITELPARLRRARSVPSDPRGTGIDR